MFSQGAESERERERERESRDDCRQLYIEQVCGNREEGGIGVMLHFCSLIGWFAMAQYPCGSHIERLFSKTKKFASKFPTM